MTRTTRTTRTQRGSVLIYIFVAIALLGALTLVVSRSTSGYTDAGEGDRLRVQSILSFIQGAALGAVRINDRGLTLTERSMVSPTSPFYGDSTANIQIFHPNGGGVSYQPGGNTVLYAETWPDPHPWVYGGNYFIRTAVSVPGIGSAAGDVVIFVMGLHQRTCSEINSFLHNTDVIPVISQPRNQFGVFTIPAISDTGNIINGHSFYCVQTLVDGTQTYLFYQVAIAR